MWRASNATVGGATWSKPLVREIGLDGNIANWLSGLAADCPQRKAAALSDRCDVRCPDLLKLALRPRNGGNATRTD